MLVYNNWTRAEISLDAIKNNYEAISAHIGKKCSVMAMVKADAYGHGAAPVARMLEKLGVGYLGVANIFEALNLREEGIKAPVLIMGFTPAELVPQLISHNITQTVQSARTAKKYSDEAMACGGCLKIHVKLDTGMSRSGILCPGEESEAAEQVMGIYGLPGIETEGAYTHFAESDGPDPAFTMEQFGCFNRVLSIIESRGAKIPIKHCANSATVIKYPRLHLDMVRAGLILYGLEPAPGMARGKIIPAMTLKTIVEQVKTIPAGACVSYGRTFTAGRPTVIATLPIGYGDGYIRACSGARMTVRGKKAPVVGRICMDMCMLDVTDIPGVSEGDEVTVFGPAPDTTADELAGKVGTINYEVVTGISKRVMRLYYEDGRLCDRLAYI